MNRWTTVWLNSWGVEKTNSWIIAEQCRSWKDEQLKAEQLKSWTSDQLKADQLGTNSTEQLWIEFATDLRRKKTELCFITISYLIPNMAKCLIYFYHILGCPLWRHVEGRAEWRGVGWTATGVQVSISSSPKRRNKKYLETFSSHPVAEPI